MPGRELHTAGELKRPSDRAGGPGPSPEPGRARNYLVLGEVPVQGGRLVSWSKRLRTRRWAWRRSTQRETILQLVPPSFWVRPGENRSCLGCHEPYNRSRANIDRWPSTAPPVALTNFATRAQTSMKNRGFATTALVSLLALGGRPWAAGSGRWITSQRWTGRVRPGFRELQPLPPAAIESLPWAQPRTAPSMPRPAWLVRRTAARFTSRWMISTKSWKRTPPPDRHTPNQSPGAAVRIAVDTGPAPICVLPRQ